MARPSSRPGQHLSIGTPETAADDSVAVRRAKFANASDPECG
jgi:hypothetical protein